MPVSVRMRGELNPILMQEDFADTVGSINQMYLQGKAFGSGHTMDGRPIAVWLGNIVSIEELDRDAPLNVNEFQGAEV